MAKQLTTTGKEDLLDVLLSPRNERAPLVQFMKQYVEPLKEELLVQYKDVLQPEKVREYLVKALNKYADVEAEF